MYKCILTFEFDLNKLLSSVKVAGVTRIRGGGLEAVQHCHMPPTTPAPEKLRSINWGKVEEHGRWLLKLFMPRVSERNGRICCFRLLHLSINIFL